MDIDMNNLTEQQVNDFLADQVNKEIEILEAEMLKHDQVEIPVKHRFVNGMYAREITIPKGTMLTGRVHKFGYIDIMLSGDITVATPDGVKRFTGINIFEGFAGRKRAGYAHEDTRWVTVHNTDETDSDRIEDHLTVMSMAEFKALPQDERAALPEEEQSKCQLSHQQ